MSTIIIGKEDYLGLPNSLWLHIFERALRGFGGPGHLYQLYLYINYF